MGIVRLHTSVFSRFAAHTNILLSQTVIEICEIRAVRSVCYHVIDELQIFQPYSKRGEGFFGLHFLGRLLIMC